MAAHKIIVSAPASEVRAWAAANGHTVGKRGKFSQELISAFNKANKVKYREGQFTPTVSHTAKPEKGRSKTIKVNPALVRQAAREAGVPVGNRGRLDKRVLDAYVLGTLDALAGDMIAEATE